MHLERHQWRPDPPPKSKRGRGRERSPELAPYRVWLGGPRWLTPSVEVVTRRCARKLYDEGLAYRVQALRATKPGKYAPLRPPEEARLCLSFDVRPVPGAPGLFRVRCPELDYDKEVLNPAREMMLLCTQGWVEAENGQGTLEAAYAGLFRTLPRP